MTSRLSAALRRRFASPAAALAALGLPVSLLEGTDMNLSHTAALSAVRAPPLATMRSLPVVRPDIEDSVSSAPASATSALHSFAASA